MIVKHDNIINFVHSFFLIKGHEHYIQNKKVIDSFKISTSLFNVAKKYQIDVVQAYKIMREYRLNELNRNVILCMQRK